MNETFTSNSATTFTNTYDYDYKNVDLIIEKLKTGQSILKVGLFFAVFWLISSIYFLVLELVLPY